MSGGAALAVAAADRLGAAADAPAAPPAQTAARLAGTPRLPASQGAECPNANARPAPRGSRAFATDCSLSSDSVHVAQDNVSASQLVPSLQTHTLIPPLLVAQALSPDDDEINAQIEESQRLLAAAEVTVNGGPEPPPFVIAPEAARSLLALRGRIARRQSEHAARARGTAVAGLGLMALRQVRRERDAAMPPTLLPSHDPASVGIRPSADTACAQPMRAIPAAPKHRPSRPPSCLTDSYIAVIPVAPRSSPNSSYNRCHTQVAPLSRGAWSRVLLVQHDASGVPYVLKRFAQALAPPHTLPPHLPSAQAHLPF